MKEHSSITRAKRKELCDFLRSSDNYPNVDKSKIEGHPLFPEIIRVYGSFEKALGYSKIGDSLQKRWEDPEYKKEQSKKISKRMKKRWEDPEYRATQIETLKTYRQNPEFREKRDRLWQNPEFREKHRKAVQNATTKYPLSEKDLEDIQELYEAGIFMPAIAEEFDVPTHIVESKIKFVFKISGYWQGKGSRLGKGRRFYTSLTKYIITQSQRVKDVIKREIFPKVLSKDTDLPYFRFMQEFMPYEHSELCDSISEDGLSGLKRSSLEQVLLSDSLPPLEQEDYEGALSELRNRIIEKCNEAITEKGYGKRIEEALSSLPERDEKIIRLRYGINGKKQTLRSIGERLGITRERVRQIENETKEKIADYLSA